MYRKAIELDPSHAKAHNNLGLLLETVRKDYDGAEKMYRKAIEVDPSHATAHLYLGNFLETMRKDDDGAEKMYRKAIELDPSHETAHNMLKFLFKARKDDAVYNSTRRRSRLTRRRRGGLVFLPSFRPG